MLDSALPPCFPENNSGVSWLIPILHSNRTFRFTSNIIQFSFNSPRPHPTEHREILTTPTQRFQEDFSIHLQRYSTFFQFDPPPPNRTQGNFNHPYPTISRGLFHSPPTLFNFRTFRPILQPIRTQGNFNHPYPTIQEYFWTCLHPFLTTWEHQ